LAHGGELKIESVIKHGTTVRVILPAAADTNLEEALAGQPSVAAEPR
jgi:hypothetical protein